MIVIFFSFHEVMINFLHRKVSLNSVPLIMADAKVKAKCAVKQ